MNNDMVDKLFLKKENSWKHKEDNDLEVVHDYAEGYMKFLNNSKTERLCIQNCVKILKDAGFRNIEDHSNLIFGDKIFYINRDKSLYAAVIGEEEISNGINIIGSHVDSPRLDLKPNPLFEKGEFAYFKTDYYGGIKKYQWTSIPLSLHGVVVKSTGEKISINIGDKKEDPIFTITDLLPHLSKEQSSKKLEEAIDGESLNVLIGNIPLPSDKTSENVKYNILKLLNEKYNITEIDFNSAELELVPAYESRSLGLDKSMIAGYGHDDRSSVYASLIALTELEEVKKTAVCIFSDKEETGSIGNTGMESETFDYFITLILEKMMINNPYVLSKIFNKSKMISADVDAAYDPNYDNVYEKNNSAMLGKGLSIVKYTGGKGKSNGSDASAEYVGYIRGLLEKNDISYQFSKLGKSDLGGGGTIAYILANKGVDVIDCGVAVLSMHAPYEVISKYDLYELYRLNKSFWIE